MLELAGVGAKVLQTRSVGLAMRDNLPLRVLSAFEDKPGTADRRDELSRSGHGTATRSPASPHDKNEARVTLTGLPDKPGTVAAVIGAARRGRHQRRHDRPARRPHRHRLERPHLHRPARQPRPGDRRCSRRRKDAIGYRRSLIHDDAVAKVSIVGVGIRSNPALAAKMFETLAERQINILAISTSEIKVWRLIAEDQLELAVRVLHTAFGLDDAEQAA